MSFMLYQPLRRMHSYIQNTSGQQENIGDGQLRVETQKETNLQANKPVRQNVLTELGGEERVEKEVLVPSHSSVRHSDCGCDRNKNEARTLGNINVTSWMDKTFWSSLDSAAHN
ncbi:uncharacterized protein LOC143040402 [Oratosquilla oratoria]|uniref:uncharacterized protein LOC143040402 n=1 Tax=Oratosquilla oratoria TaxID=337810 RepID=UPI003F75F33F